MYPSSRQSPGSGVGLERGAGGGLTGTEAAMVTNVADREDGYDDDQHDHCRTDLDARVERAKSGERGVH